MEVKHKIVTYLNINVTVTFQKFISVRCGGGFKMMSEKYLKYCLICPSMKTGVSRKTLVL